MCFKESQPSLPLNRKNESGVPFCNLYVIIYVLSPFYP
ncbi:unnamed protein product [Arabidopsis halleri]